MRTVLLRFQVFYVVPRIEMIEDEVQMIKMGLPDARVGFAYGGLKGLEKRITEFALGEIDVMVGCE